MKRRIYFATAVLAGFIATQCSRDTLGRFLTRGSGNPSGDVVEGEAPITPAADNPGPDSGNPGGKGGTETTGHSFIENWLQPPEGIPKPVDIIVTTDTSGSLDDERSAVTTALQGFFSTLESKNIKDYCIGVILGHLGQRAGSLRAINDDPSLRCLCKQASAYKNNTQALIDAFGKNFKQSLPGDDVASDGGEAMIYSFHQAISDASVIADNASTGCFRKDAALAFVPVTDENDIMTAINCASTNYSFSPVGPAQVVDGDCQEAPARMTYYSNADGSLALTPQKFVNDARIFQSPLPFFAAIVGYVGSNIPAGGENERAYGFVDGPDAANDNRTKGVVDLVGGDQVDLALATAGDQAAFNDDFVSFANALAGAVQLSTVFTISHRACEGSITVMVDGVAKPFTYDGSHSIALSLANAGTYNSPIEISYNECI